MRRREANCLFGDGAAFWRVSRIGRYGFLVSDLSSYRRLRQLLAGDAGFAGWTEAERSQRTPCAVQLRSG